MNEPEPQGRQRGFAIRLVTTRRVGLQAILPAQDIFLQHRHTSAQILRIFHPGPPSGFGRRSLHPKYFRPRNRGPSSFTILRKSEPSH